MEIDDGPSWELASKLVGDRSELMREMRFQYLEMDPPLKKRDLINIFLITNTVEEVFFLLSKLKMDFSPFSLEAA